jgi:hypothetical protein
MKFAFKVLLVGVAACTFVAPASAYTINGTIPAHSPPQSVVINLHRPIKPGFMKFTISAPKHNAGVAYSHAYCIGPAANPCGSVGSRVVTVPEGETRDVIVPSSIFLTAIFVVGQGTKVTVPYAVTVDYVP